MNDLGDRFVSRAEIARLAGVRRPAVSNWERRHPDTFPRPASAGEDGTELFRAAEVVDWLDHRAIPANARENGEPAGTTYGDRFRAGLQGGAEAAPKTPAPAPDTLVRGVEQALAQHGGTVSPEHVEMLLALLCLRGSRPEAWRALSSAAAGTTPPEPTELCRRITSDLPVRLSPTTLQTWQEGGRSLVEAIRLIDTHGTGERSECVAAFDHLIEWAARTGPARTAGEFFTPPSITRTVTRLLAPSVDAAEVHDPFCRTGEMLAAIVDTRGVSGRTRPLRVSGAGTPDFSLRLARLGMDLRGYDPADLVQGASTPSEYTAPLRRKVDLLVTNPPFNTRVPESPRNTGHWRYGPPPPHRANFDWLQYAVDSLSADGRACVVMAAGATFSNSSRERQIRSAMVTDGAVECVVELPPGLFFPTGIAVTLWLLRAPTGSCEEVLFITARAMGTMATRAVRSLSEQESDAIAHEYHAWRDSGGTGGAYRGSPGFSRAVGLDEIRANDYALTPSRYVSPVPETDSAPARKDSLGRLSAKLVRLHEEAARIDAFVESILRRHDV
ncbi:N-6 DNA methylase [Streptomyces macrosporus]|uniref:DNA methylase adenine-specific domain-containing protein n=1 Tax=Streptomyces macrosporus TaxID=44032 RepID=A0ABP5WLF7_9ACTN